jgi:hypothetical protein
LGHGSDLCECYRASWMFNGVKIFSATMLADRERLGEKITAWLQAHPRYRLVDIWVTQSSDMSFHCLAITIFYFDPDAP